MIYERERIDVPLTYTIEMFLGWHLSTRQLVQCELQLLELQIHL